MSNGYLRNSGLLNQQNSRLLIVDVQTKLVPSIDRAEYVIGHCRMLIEAAMALEIPVTSTEQYPDGLGPTVFQLHDILNEPIAKKRFSAAECLNWPTAGDATDGRFQVIVAGLETHICVLQTALDLVAMGYEVYVPLDATASRFDFDRKVASERMQSKGVNTLTTESVLFEWCETAEHENFGVVSKLVKHRSE